jgi:hypothetical protein
MYLYTIHIYLHVLMLSMISFYIYLYTANVYLYVLICYQLLFKCIYVYLYVSKCH